MNAPLVDTHCHLDYAARDGLLDAWYRDADAANVRGLVTIGCSLASATWAVNEASQRTNVWTSVGLHPHEAASFEATQLAAFEQLARQPRVVAIGEIGLDFHYDYSPRDVQTSVFRTFIGLAKQLKKPIVVHTRSAPAETLAVLREENARDVGGIIHCFSEDAEFARAALDLNFDCSFSGIVTFKRSQAIRDAARVVPLDRLLVETDAPYLAPEPWRGKPNHPAWVARTAEVLASVVGCDVDTLRLRTTENAARRLGLDASMLLA